LSNGHPVALITDWRGTAGPAIAFALAQAGFALLINGPEDEVFELQSVDTMARILAMPFDVADEQAVLNAVGASLEVMGRLDVLVNNIFAWNDAALDDITEEMWDEVLKMGLKGTFYCSRAAARVMKAQEYGKIIHVTSTSALTGVHTQYAASCAAIHSLTRSLARELAPHVRVNSIAAGLLDEPWVDEGGPELREVLTRDIPLKRLCRGEDVAEAVSYLAAGADFMTGQVLILDGGETMR